MPKGVRKTKGESTLPDVREFEARTQLLDLTVVGLGDYETVNDLEQRITKWRKATKEMSAFLAEYNF